MVWGIRYGRRMVGSEHRYPVDFVRAFYHTWLSHNTIAIEFELLVSMILFLHSF